MPGSKSEHLRDAPPTPPIQDIHSLIDAIRDLYHRLFHEGLGYRLKSHHVHNRNVDFPSIAAAMDEGFASTQVGAGALSSPDVVSGSLLRTPAAPTISEPAPSELGSPALGARFLSNKRLNVLYHPTGERLRRSAQQHLMKAICLRRQQRHAEAKTHGRLAEAAIEEARRYLPPDDFLDMKRDFESRLLPLKNPAQPT